MGHTPFPGAQGTRGTPGAQVAGRLPRARCLQAACAFTPGHPFSAHAPEAARAGPARRAACLQSTCRATCRATHFLPPHPAPSTMSAAEPVRPKPVATAPPPPPCPLSTPGLRPDRALPPAGLLGPPSPGGLTGARPPPRCLRPRADHPASPSLPPPAPSCSWRTSGAPPSRTPQSRPWEQRPPPSSRASSEVSLSMLIVATKLRQQDGGHQAPLGRGLGRGERPGGAGRATSPEGSAHSSPFTAAPIRRPNHLCRTRRREAGELPG